MYIKRESHTYIHFIMFQIYMCISIASSRLQPSFRYSRASKDANISAFHFLFMYAFPPFSSSFFFIFSRLAIEGNRQTTAKLSFIDSAEHDNVPTTDDGTTKFPRKCSTILYKVYLDECTKLRKGRYCRARRCTNVILINSVARKRYI